MCLGFPMTVISGDGAAAVCERRGARESVSMLLVGQQRQGTRLLVHLGTAMRVLDPQEAEAIDKALDGLSAALRGENVDAFFEDLIGREPELPAFLREDK